VSLDRRIRLHTGLMDKDSEIPATPLSVWTLALLLAVVLGFGAFECLFRWGPPGLTAFEQYNLGRVREFSKRSADADLRIVMLGNSRLKYSTPPDDEFSKLLSKASGRHVEVLRLVNNWAVFHDFAELLDPIAALKPDIIVLQLQLLGQERALGARSLILQDYVDWLISGNHQPWNPGDIDQAALQTAVPCVHDFSDAALRDRLTRTRQWLNFDPDSPSGRKAREWARAEADATVKVMILSIPRTPTIEQSTGVDFDDQSSDVVDRLLATQGISFARFDEPLPRDAFCDVVHMDKQGRRRMTAWLIERLTALEGEKPPYMPM
jgi:hypothetical protein